MMGCYSIRKKNNEETGSTLTKTSGNASSTKAVKEDISKQMLTSFDTPNNM